MEASESRRLFEGLVSLLLVARAPYARKRAFRGATEKMSKICFS